MRKSGFTLIELLIAISILGILAALIVPRLAPQTERARAAEAISMLSAIRQGEEAFFLENGNYGDPAIIVGGWAALGLTNPNTGNPNAFFTYAVNVPGGCTGFTAIATRNGLSGGDSISTIGIDSNGTYCGTHPNVPPNPAGAGTCTC